MADERRLRDICIRKVLQYSKLIERGFHLLPSDVNQDILDSAIRSCSITSLSNVLRWWPSRVLVLRGDGTCSKDDLFVANAVAEYIAGRDETDSLQLIDMRERKIGFDGTTVLCKAIITANKNYLRCGSRLESSRRTLPSVLNRCHVRKDTPSGLTVYASIFVSYSNPEAVLQAVHLEDASVQLWISAFYAVELGDDRLCQFLQLLNANHLKSLDFSFNGLACYDNVCMDLSRVWDEMQKLVGLSALSLSHNDLGESHLRDLCRIMERFTSLVSLDLSGNYVGSSIKLLLDSLAQPLHHLRLGQCRIRNAGIKYIANSRHSSQLRELDLSWNCLSSECLGDLMSILESSKDTIELLNISGNQIPLHSELFLACISSLRNLKLLVVSPVNENAPDITCRFRQTSPLLEVKVDLCYVGGNNMF